MKTVKLSEESLENLLIAIMNLKNEKDLLICIRPEYILQTWVLEQIPKPPKSCNL